MHKLHIRARRFRCGKSPGLFICSPTSRSSTLGNCLMSLKSYKSAANHEAAPHGNFHLSLSVDGDRSRSEPD